MLLYKFHIIKINHSAGSIIYVTFLSNKLQPNALFIAERT